MSKLLYSLESVVCKEIDRRKIHAFHCRCLRQILGIPHSYISHVSNSEVFLNAKSRSLYQILIERQLKFYASILKRPHNHVGPGNYITKTWQLKRVRARSCFEWTNVIRAYNSSIMIRHRVNKLQYFSGDFYICQ